MADDNKPAQAKTAIPPRRVSMDTFVVTVDGIEYFPHAGEFVDYVRGLSWSYFMMQRKASAAKDGTAEATVISWESMVGTLPDCILGWTLKDDFGNPLPQPYRNPEAFRTLTADELNWLNQNVIPITPPQS